MIETEVLALLLAGGQGSRLKSLTKLTAKPAVPFGGKYRIIDFALSNAVNSRVANIGILTQYEPHILNNHIGIGSAWDFDHKKGGLRVLPPYTSEDGGQWYTGTANAIYENMAYIDDIDPKYVLVLSGDHIYKMDYRKMLAEHVKTNATTTIAVMEVPWEEAFRFGILNVDHDNQIIEFDEKPENPKNNMASMGIYIFDWKVLREYLIADANDATSHHDFGKNILPKMLADLNKMVVWSFDGYWKDVGTIDSYWEANMDLLDEDNPLDLYNRDWRVFTKNKNLPAHLILENAVVNNSLINEGCIVDGEIHNSILFPGVTVEKNAKVYNSIVFSNTVIEEDAEIYNTIILEDTKVPQKTKIGKEDDERICVYSENGIEES